MAKKKSKAKEDEISPGVKFPSKDELRKMYLTGDDVARLIVLKDRLNEILSRFTRMNEQEQKEVAELKEEINQINK
jgi:Tfp pilus assembly protein PilO